MNAITHNLINPSAEDSKELRIDDLVPSRVDLTEEEIRSVSGGQRSWHVSWTSGSGGGADEWVLR